VNPVIGWTLAVIATALAWLQYGWPGVLLALSVIVFWLLLQFSRAVRAMKNAGSAPIGHVASAVMLNTRLKPGMTLLEIITLTKSLGRRVGEPEGESERWRWEDDGGVGVTLALRDGRLVEWALVRPDQAGSGSAGSDVLAAGDAGGGDSSR
jgi:hypothetical protein